MATKKKFTPPKIKPMTKAEIEAYKKKHPNAGRYNSGWEAEEAAKKSKAKKSSSAKTKPNKKQELVNV